MAAISALSTSGYSAYAPFLGRFQLSLMDLRKYDIAAGRPKLAAWIEAQNDWIPKLIEKLTNKPDVTPKSLSNFIGDAFR
ncbi:hypothetical protein ACFX15_040444 [Malus domestica]